MKNIYILPLILFSLFPTFSFSEDLRVEIIKRYDNGQKKLLVIYKGEGIDEVITKRITFNENGDTLRVEKPLDKLKMEWEYYENGQMEKEGTYIDGKRDGKWTYYNEDGSLIGERIYKDGEIWNGFVVYYNENGKIKKEKNYKDGELDGYEKEYTYYENGQISFERNLKDGELCTTN